MRISGEVRLIIALLLIIGVLAMAIQFFKIDADESSASSFVIEDLREKYPEADIEIMSIKSKVNNEGREYFELKAKVTRNPATACPERIHIHYNYPSQNFVPAPNEYITRNCRVCTEGICTLAFPEEAIIASHTFEGTEEVDNYLSRYPSAEAVYAENHDSWMVSWNSPLSMNSYEVIISKEGEVLSVSKIEKE
jgi:hypothetical protein